MHGCGGKVRPPWHRGWLSPAWGTHLGNFNDRSTPKSSSLQARATWEFSVLCGQS